METKSRKRYEEIAHTADWSFRVFGRDLHDLFENAAYAMFAMEGATESNANRMDETMRDIVVNGIDYESLLVNWLNELLFWQDTQHETYYRFHIDEITPTVLHAQVFGFPFTNLNKIIKAVTYHNLKIEQIHDGWEAVLVVDV